MDTPDTLKEYRSVPFVDMEAASDGGQFVGYAAVFDQEADLGTFTESVSRGAFRKSLAAGDNVPMLYDHQEHLPVLATTRAGTLKLSEDTKGLKVEADIANHFMGDAVREMVKRGDIDGMSWGFVAGPGNSRLEQRGSKPHRSLLNFKRLLDVSPTWDKTYASTEAAFRSLRMLQELATDLVPEEQELEGVAPQLENEAPEPEPETPQHQEEDDEQQQEQEHHSESTDDDSGVAVRAAAMRRRLHMMGISIPAEYR